MSSPTEHFKLDIDEINSVVHRLRRRGDYDELASKAADEESELLGRLFAQASMLSDQDVEVIESLGETDQEPSNVTEEERSE